MKQALAKDGELVLTMVVAEKLGYTLTELQAKMTPEELYLWSLFYQHRSEEEQKVMNKAQRKRR